MRSRAYARKRAARCEKLESLQSDDNIILWPVDVCTLSLETEEKLIDTSAVGSEKNTLIY